MSQESFTAVTKRMGMEGVCHKGVSRYKGSCMEGVCFKGYSHLLPGGGERKVFVVNEFRVFYFYYKESGMEGICRKGVSHLLESER